MKSITWLAAGITREVLIKVLPCAVNSSSAAYLTPQKVILFRALPFYYSLYIRCLIHLFYLESDINNYFGQFGNVVDVAIMRDKSSGKSRGFAFVTFKESSREAG